MTTLITHSTPVSERNLAPRPAPRDAVSQILTMAWRALVKMRRNPEQFFDVALQPILFTAMFAYIFGGAVSGSVKDYLPVIIPGVLAQTALTASMATGTQLREDMDKGVFDRFKSLPISRIAPLAGPMVADLVRYTIASVLTVGMGMAMGYRPGGGVLGVVGGCLLTILTGWSIAWIFTWLGTVLHSARSVSSISMMILFPLTFLSNAFVPVQTLPGWLRDFVNVNPVSQVVSACRALINNGDLTAHAGWSLVGCAVMILIFAPLSVISYNRNM